ncbi:Protein N-acetyltransferase, RimJ/RimL family [Paenibacillus barengoltzii]|uniref:GNAT family N-acetyltransferase n=1 Tax=Paenibacillus barengoltzii TaxID=343517 RepID=UPI000A08D871|nr:GNAT family N-acetyltransferase [Paenibacillus barengoltzii]SME94777.1 Protein N-acetyltransferase, RimJ/RimL family [Paenibacillus barengoltzii]
MSNQTRLRFYSEEDFEALQHFELPSEQVMFTALPGETLEAAIQDPNRYPVVIQSEEGETVGFFVLHLNADITSLVNNPKAILLRALSIDYRKQGKGYATAAMLQLPTFVRECFPEVDEIVLAVNARNFTAQRLYLRTGFEDHGLTRLGPIGMQHIYHFKVERS